MDCPEPLDRLLSRMSAWIKFKELSLDGDHITHGAISHLVSTVKHLSFERVHTTHRRNFVTAGKTFRSTLNIEFDDGERISSEVDDTGIFLSWNKDQGDGFSKIREYFGQLSTATFQKRISPYLASLREKGQFEFGGCRFIPPDKVVYKDQTFVKNETAFLRHHSHIELRKKTPSVRERIMRHMPVGDYPNFKTQWDSDVIFTLLNHCFNLKWE